MAKTLIKIEVYRTPDDFMFKKHAGKWFYCFWEYGKHGLASSDSFGPFQTEALAREASTKA